MVADTRWHIASKWGFALLAPAVGYVLAYLVVTGNWPLALVLVLALPSIILLHRYPFLCLLIWFCLAPFLMNTPSDMLRRIYWIIHRFLPPITLGIIVISSMLRIRVQKLPKLGPAEAAMAGYLAISMISTIYLSNNVRATIYIIYDSIFVPMCLYLIIRMSNPGEQDLQRLIPLLFALCTVQIFVGIVSWTVPQALPSMWRNAHVESRTIGTLVNPTTFSLGLMFCGLLLLQAGLTRRLGLTRFVYIAGFVAVVIFIFLTFTRSSWLGGALVLLGLMTLYPGFIIRLMLIGAVVVTLAGGVLLSDQIDRANQRLYSSESSESALSRLPVYFAAIQMFEAKPLFGWGYNNFDRYDREFQARVGDLVNAQKDHASHNTYLTVLAEQGLAGFVLYLTPMLWWCAQTAKTLPMMPKEGFWGRKLLLVLWLFVLFFVVVNNFFRVYIVFGLGLYWITLGFIAVIVSKSRRKSGTSISGSNRGSIRAGIY